MHKKISIFIVVIIAASSFFVLNPLKKNLYEQITSYEDPQVIVDADNITIQGVAELSKYSVTNYEVKSEGDALLVYLKGYLFAHGNPEGEYRFVLNKIDENISKIYLAGEKKDQKKLLWSK